MMFVLLLSILSLPFITLSLDNGMALTPPIGFNSFLARSLRGQAGLWSVAHFFATSTTSTDHSRTLQELGYLYINTDEGWEQSERTNDTQQLQWNTTQYPDGLPSFVDQLHSAGFRFGIYGSASGVTCGNRPGQLHYEQHDAATYIQWGVDFVKLDTCAHYALDASVRYAALRDALREQRIVLSIEPFSIRPDPLQSIEVANLWRVGCDIEPGFASFTNRADLSDKWSPLAGVGGWNDPDMIHLRNPSNSSSSNDEGNDEGLSLGENRLYFGLWAMMKAPLLLSTDVLGLHQDIIDIVGNEEVIAINQDALGIQARKLLVNGVPLPWLVDLEDCAAARPGRLERHFRKGHQRLLGDTRMWSIRPVFTGIENTVYQLVNDLTGRCLTALSKRGSPFLLPCDTDAWDETQHWIFEKGVSTVTSITNVAMGGALAIRNSTLYGSHHWPDPVNVSEAAYGQGGLTLIPLYNQDNCTNRDCQNYDPSQMWYYSPTDRLLRHALYTASINHKPVEGEGYRLTHKVPTFQHFCLAHVLSVNNLGSLSGDLEVWGGPLVDGDYVVGFANRGTMGAYLTIPLEQLHEGIHHPNGTGDATTRYTVRNLWNGTTLGCFEAIFTDHVGGHDLGLYRLSRVPTCMAIAA